MNTRTHVFILWFSSLQCVAYLHVVEEATKACFSNAILILKSRGKALEMRGSYSTEGVNYKLLDHHKSQCSSRDDVLAS
jgi:hypothetical protein